MRTRKLPYPEWMLDEIVDKSIIPNLTSIPTTTKILFRCPQCKQEYLQTIHNHICSDNTPKQGCPYCSKQKRAESYSCICTNNRKPYPQWFIDDLVNQEDKERAKLGDIKVDEHLLFCCPQCNKEYTQRVASHITISTGEKKKGCPVCGIKKQIESSRQTKNIVKPYPQWFIDELYLQEDKEYASSNNFYGYEEKQFYCKKHNVVYTKKVQDRIDLRTHKPKSGCPQCCIENRRNNNTKKYPSWFIDDLYQDTDRERARKGTLHTSERVQFHCENHNCVYTQLVSNHKKQNYGCPECKKEKFFFTKSSNREYPQWFINELVYTEDKHKALDGTLSSTDIVSFQCSSHHVYQQQVKDHIILSKQERYKGCPYCTPYRSSTELEIEEFIKSLGFHTEHKRFQSSKLPLFEADIYIPEKRIAIEFNGSFFHKSLPDDGNNKSKMYHNQKFHSFKELGIRLISIFDVDWNTQKEKIKMYLKDTLSVSLCKVAARKCEIRHIDYHTANTLYEQYHLLGATTVQSVSYGLFYNNELLSCMSFQKGRYKNNKNPSWCLTRYVTKSGYSIIGGASKLLKRFEKEYHPEILVSYSDNDYFDGNLYSNLNFTCVGDTNSPRYYWFYHNRELKREHCQLKNLSKNYPELYSESLNQHNKEDFIMLQLGACKVYRSGHTKWIKKY